ncbi:MAG TPA: Cof-type HAD-IIB family hydrolase [Candidatus Deferrimicrobiaceae bacterium]|nr:Cof-type HAD-IIB family hydrolase [Candidatus Deferrimicrobiaceae bacterium]
MSSGFAARSVAPVLPIRMLALDIDGTLVGDDLVLPDRTRATIVRAVHRGIRVSLVTGRMPSSALPFARLLELRDPIIGYQGALIREMPRPASNGRGRLLLHRPLPADVARDAVAWARQAGLEPHLNHLEFIVFPADDPRGDDYSAFLGARAVRVPDLDAWIRQPVTKVVAVAPPPRPVGSLETARRAFAGRADVTVAHPRFLEFVAPGISKGWAVRWLARRQGIDLGAVLAIGDQLNDVEMISAVGHGAAMPSAPREVLAVARYVAPPLEEEGAARLIEDLVLAGPRQAAKAAAAYEARTHDPAPAPR